MIGVFGEYIVDIINYFQKVKEDVLEVVMFKIIIDEKEVKLRRGKFIVFNRKYSMGKDLEVEEVY